MDCKKRLFLFFFIYLFIYFFIFFLFFFSTLFSANKLIDVITIRLQTKSKLVIHRSVIE